MLWLLIRGALQNLHADHSGILGINYATLSILNNQTEQANNVDLDQNAPEEAVWSGSVQYAIKSALFRQITRLSIGLLIDQNNRAWCEIWIYRTIMCIFL